MAVVRLDVGFRCSEDNSIMRTHVGDKCMALEIVWRNPHPLAKAEHKLQRIRKDRLGAVYAVTCPDLTQEFELILGTVA